MRRGVGALALAGLISAGLPAEGMADRTLIQTDRASQIAAYGGVRVWTMRTRTDRYVLMWQKGSGPVRFARVKSSPRPFEPDVGPASGGGYTVVVSRCDGSDCDIHTVNLRRGRERRVRGASTSSCQEGAPSVWGSTIAFTRRTDARGRRCRHEGRLLLAKRGRVRRLPERNVNETELSDRWVAVGSITNGTRVLLQPRSGGPRTLVEEAGAGPRGGTEVGGVVLDGEHLYYNRVQLDTSQAVLRQSVIRRRASAQPGEAETAATRFAFSLAVDGGAIFYANRFGVFRYE